MRAIAQSSNVWEPYPELDAGSPDDLQPKPEPRP